jgi:hypothetical protein
LILLIFGYCFRFFRYFQQTLKGIHSISLVLLTNPLAHSQRGTHWREQYRCLRSPRVWHVVGHAEPHSFQTSFFAQSFWKNIKLINININYFFFDTNIYNFKIDLLSDDMEQTNAKTRSKTIINFIIAKLFKLKKIISKLCNNKQSSEWNFKFVCFQICLFITKFCFSTLSHYIKAIKLINK